MLKLININFNYIDKLLLNNLSLTIPSNTIFHIKGHNGSGKTTLLKLLVGLMQPQAGEILYNNEPITNCLSAYQQQLCYIGHKPGVHQGLTVQEYCRFEANYQTNTISTLLRDFGLGGLENKLCGLLSFGQRRRLGLMRLLSSNASIWFLDEPFIALDHKSLDLLMHAMQQQIKRGGSIILTSHQAFPSNLDQYSEYLLS